MEIKDKEIAECALCSLVNVRKARHDGKLGNLEDLVTFCLLGRLKRLGIGFMDGLGSKTSDYNERTIDYSDNQELEYK